jgi:hypothetical protein
MFKITKSPTFWNTVTFEETDEQGRKVTRAFECQYKRLTVDEIKDLSEKIRKDESGDAGYARELVVGWRGVEDDSGPVECNAGNIDLAIQRGVASAMVSSFFDGYPKAKQKN